MAELKNVRWEKFAQGIASGLSQRKAYREAFPSSKQWKDRTVDSKACELTKNEKIMDRVQELQQATTSVLIKSVTERKEWLSSVMDDMTERTENKLKACDILNKMDGEYVTKVDADVNSEVNIHIELSDE